MRSTMALKLPSASAWQRLFFFLCVVVACFGMRSDPASSEDATPAKFWHSGRVEGKGLWVSGSSFLREVSSAELDSCEEIYSFFPCSTSIGGNLFLVIVYGYFLLTAAKFLSSGSELLLAVMNPGLIGGLLLPILGALPDALLILVSGLSASATEAQSEVLVGMGLLAGSNIMLLTALWGGCLLVGRCDLVRSRGQVVAKDKTLTKGWSLTGTGVTTDQQTRVASWIMICTVLPYLVAQTPVVFGWSKSTGSVFVLLGCAISVIGLCCYCTYQVSFPWIQERWIYRAKENVRKFNYVQMCAEWGSVLESDGTTPNRVVLQSIFEHFDKDHDQQLSEEEVKNLIIDLGKEHEGKIASEEEVKHWIEDFDKTNDGKISNEEFLEGMEKWIRLVVKDGIVGQSKQPRRNPSTVRRSSSSSLRRIETKAVRQNTSNGTEAASRPYLFWSEQAQTSLDALLDDQAADDEDDDEGQDDGPTERQVITKAVLLLILGAVTAGVVADPLVDAIKNFSSVTGIPPFFISFVATPLATNSSEAISSLVFAMRRRKKNISMTYSQIYGGVTMNNTLCLGIFLAIVYTRGLTWDFSSEVLVILVATAIIGALAAVRVTFPSWMAIVSLFLYPFSIALVAVLDYVYGWQ